MVYASLRTQHDQLTQLISQHYQGVTFPLWFHACRAAALGQLPPLKPVGPVRRTELLDDDDNDRAAAHWRYLSAPLQ
jgi:hypothetical protein